MKKYSTTLLNGFILGISTILFIGAKSQDKNLGDITVNSIKVIDEYGIMRASLGMNDKGNVEINMKSKLGHTAMSGGAILLENPKGNSTITMFSNNEMGGFLNIRDSEGNIITSMGSGKTGDGRIQTYDSKGNELTFMGATTSGGGAMATYNSKGNRVVYIGPDKVNKDGAILLMDRYGDVGWKASGKR